MEKNEEDVPRELYNGKYWVARILKYLLENKGIEVVLVDKTNSPIAFERTIPNPSDIVTVLVPTLYYEKAMLIVSEYKMMVRDRNLII